MIHQTQLIDALKQPTAYPHQPAQVDFLQTHISLLFFAGDRVYKVKKPVDLGFLDYTTIERRKHFCEEEVRLNRRLATDIYLGVVPIVRDRDGSIHVGRAEPATDSESETIDYAVEMVRLPDDRMLPALIEREEVGEREMRAIAKLLVDFHASCPAGDDINQYATAESLQQQAADNIAQLRSIGREEHLLSTDLIDHISAWCDQFLRDHKDLIADRLARGRAREGHGDLHAGNICLLEDGRIIIYDCIEFTPKFRCRDVAGELGFLAMDMDYRGHRELGGALVEAYASLARDDEMLKLLDFFKVHFAIVRAKVSAIKSTEAEVQPSERSEAAREASRYLHLAAGYTVAPALILMCGMPATGKSTIARELARPLCASILRSDIIRKELAGVAPTERGDPFIYTDELTDRTYARLAERARIAIESGNNIIADATFASPRRRESMIRIAEDTRVPWALVHTTADERTIRDRMNARAADQREVSDADWFVYERFRDHFQPPDEIAREHRITVDEDLPIDDAIALTLSALVHQAARTNRCAT
jgi:uncharacterized protein